MFDLKKARLDAGLTQKQLGEMCKVKRNTIASIELGNVGPSVKTAKLIGKALGIDWTEFFSDEPSA